MRRRIRGAGSDSAEVNMTPMLDIVFILLIFFIVTATFLQEKGIEMIAPPNDDQPQNPNPAPSILVQIDDASSVYVNGRLTDVARVTAAVQRANVDGGGQSAVVIQPALNARHGVVTRVYDASVAARVKGVVVRKPEAAN